MTTLCSPQGAWKCWAGSSQEVPALFAVLAIDTDGTELVGSAYQPNLIAKDKLMAMVSLSRNIIGNELVENHLGKHDLPIPVFLAAITAVTARISIMRSLENDAVPFGFPRWGNPPSDF